MRIGLVGFGASGKTTVFAALSGAESAAGKGALATVRVPDARIDKLSDMWSPRKTTYAEIMFSDVGGGHGDGIDRTALAGMREMDALCQVLRAFPDAAGAVPDPMRELTGLETETILADLELVEKRIAKLTKERTDPRELELMKRLEQSLSAETPIRAATMSGMTARAAASSTSPITMSTLSVCSSFWTAAVAACGVVPSSAGTTSASASDAAAT